MLLDAVIKALQLHQVLAQAGAGPAKFSHVSSTTTSAAAPVNTVTTSTSSHESNLVCLPPEGHIFLLICLEISRNITLATFGVTNWPAQGGKLFPRGDSCPGGGEGYVSS